MSFPNVSDIIATTIENRSRKIADNVTKNNALLAYVKKRGNLRSFSGGRVIYEELSFAENGNAGWYSGYDPLPIAAQDVVSSAEFDIKQAACPVTISGLEQLQNAGKEQMIDLMEARINVAESTMANLISDGIYSDGTGSGGKEIDGLDAAIPLDPTTSTVYGGINQSSWTFWRNYVKNDANTSTLLASWNTIWANLVRGSDHPDLILCDNVVWLAYLTALQAQQRFVDAAKGEYGWPTLAYMGADVILDGGIGGFCNTGTAFFLNTKYIFYRPHSARNFVPLAPNKRHAVNQDAEVQILAWAGNVTCSGRKFQGRYDGNA